MYDLEQLLERLRRIEALFARPGTEGERLAAEQARLQIMARLADIEQRDPPVEYKFTLSDQWSRRIMMALLRRYNITPYRYRGQRMTTVMARVSVSFVDDTLWPEYCALQDSLEEYFDQFTEQVIADILQADSRDAEERATPAGLPVNRK